MMWPPRRERKAEDPIRSACIVTLGFAALAVASALLDRSRHQRIDLYWLSVWPAFWTFSDRGSNTMRLPRIPSDLVEPETRWKWVRHQRIAGLLMLGGSLAISLFDETIGVSLTVFMAILFVAFLFGMRGVERQIDRPVPES